MNWDAIGAIGEIIGAVAVVASLAYVALQIRHNTTALQSTNRQALVENDRESILATLQNIDLLVKLGTDKPLSPEDQAKFSLIWIIDLRNRELEYFQYKAGAIDEAAWNSYRETLHYTFGTERDRKWWRKVGRNSFDKDFARMVDEFIESEPLNEFFKDIYAWDD